MYYCKVVRLSVYLSHSVNPNTNTLPSNALLSPLANTDITLPFVAYFSQVNPSPIQKNLLGDI